MQSRARNPTDKQTTSGGNEATASGQTGLSRVYHSDLLCRIRFDPTRSSINKIALSQTSTGPLAHMPYLRKLHAVAVALEMLLS